MAVPAVLTVGGIVGLATGRYGTGLAALMIGEVGPVLTIAGWAFRRRRLMPGIRLDLALREDPSIEKPDTRVRSEEVGQWR